MIHTKNNGAMCRSVISLRIAEFGLHSCQNKIKLSHVPSAHPRFNNAATKKQSGNVCWPPISYILVFWGDALLIVMVQTCMSEKALDRSGSTNHGAVKKGRKIWNCWSWLRRMSCLHGTYSSTGHFLRAFLIFEKLNSSFILIKKNIFTKNQVEKNMFVKD